MNLYERNNRSGLSGFWGLGIVAMIVTVLVNAALLVGAVWLVVKVLQYLNVI